MSNLLLAVITFLAGPAVLWATQSSVANFSVTIEATPMGWAARCDSGCAWRKLAFECPVACDAILDSNGLVTAATLRPAPATFRMVLVRGPRGIVAHARQGTAWSQLAWSCEPTSCSAEVNGYGVSGPRNPR